MSSVTAESPSNAGQASPVSTSKSELATAASIEAKEVEAGTPTPSSNVDTNQVAGASAGSKPSSASNNDTSSNNHKETSDSHLNANAYANANANAYNNVMPTTPLSPMHPPPMHQAYYYQQGQVPNSPATPSMGNGGYDVNVQSLLGQQNYNSNNVFMRQQYPTIPPLSPAMNTGAGGIGVNVVGMNAGVDNHGQGPNHAAGPGGNNNGGFVGGGADQQDINLSMGTVPPASPLFPGAPVAVFGGEHVDNHNGIGLSTIHGVNVGMNRRSMVTPNSPSLQYLTGPPPSPIVSYGGMYPSGLQPGSPEVPFSWTDSRSVPQQQMYPPSTPTPSPHLQSIQYQQNQARRTTSFDGELLPPAALEQDPGSSVYAASSGTLFSTQQPWSYSSGPNSSPYTQQNHIQQQHQHQTASVSLQPNIRSPPRARQGRGGQGPPQQQPNFYPAATPGPPIQTTHHNKGPEGANLFIFHIPNHFTNLDMWHLFCHYGNLLSVRIMVEKDTGRSRGFGFVSYDSPDAAALAIKELNGFVVGNKRLKVQHKQIRQGEMNAQQQSQQMYPESVEHGHALSASYVQPHNISPSHQVSQNSGFHLAENDNMNPQPENAILSLESIGEALPEVSK